MSVFSYWYFLFDAFLFEAYVKKAMFLIDNIFKNVNDWKLNCTDIFKNIKDAEKKLKKRLTWCIRLFNSVISFFSVPCKKAHKACGYLKFLWYWADESLWLPLNGTSVHRRLTTSISLYPIISGRTKTM